MRTLIAPQPLELSQTHERRRCVVKARAPTAFMPAQAGTQITSPRRGRRTASECGERIHAV